MRRLAPIRSGGPRAPVTAGASVPVEPRDLAHDHQRQQQQGKREVDHPLEHPRPGGGGGVGVQSVTRGPWIGAVVGDRSTSSGHPLPVRNALALPRPNMPQVTGNFSSPTRAITPDRTRDVSSRVSTVRGSTITSRLACRFLGATTAPRPRPANSPPVHVRMLSLGDSAVDSRAPDRPAAQPGLRLVRPGCLEQVQRHRRGDDPARPHRLLPVENRLPSSRNGPGSAGMAATPPAGSSPRHGPGRDPVAPSLPARRATPPVSAPRRPACRRRAASASRTDLLPVHRHVEPVRHLDRLP